MTGCQGAPCGPGRREAAGLLPPSAAGGCQGDAGEHADGWRLSLPQTSKRNWIRHSCSSSHQSAHLGPAVAVRYIRGGVQPTHLKQKLLEWPSLGTAGRPQASGGPAERGQFPAGYLKGPTQGPSVRAGCKCHSETPRSCGRFGFYSVVKASITLKKWRGILPSSRVNSSPTEW